LFWRAWWNRYTTKDKPNDGTDHGKDYAFRLRESTIIEKKANGENATDHEHNFEGLRAISS
jgi:hypothetical protein